MAFELTVTRNGRTKRNRKFENRTTSEVDKKLVQHQFPITPRDIQNSSKSKMENEKNQTENDANIKTFNIVVGRLQALAVIHVTQNGARLAKFDIEK